MKSKTFSENLTAEEIYEIDMVASDEAAANRTLQVALNYHSNKLVDLRKKRKEFWDALHKKYPEMDKNKSYTIDTSGVEVKLVEKLS